MMPILLAFAAAAAQPAQPACVRMQPVPGFSGWGHPSGAAPAVGSEAMLALKPAAQVTFRPALARRAKPSSYGGYFPLTITRAGQYKVALSDGAWIDLVQRGERLKSANHAHGPACSGIAKMVAFDLKPGRYWIQLSEAPSASIGLMVSPA